MNVSARSGTRGLDLDKLRVTFIQKRLCTHTHTHTHMDGPERKKFVDDDWTRLIFVSYFNPKRLQVWGGKWICML